MEISDTSDALRMIKAMASTTSVAVVEARAEHPLTLQLDPGQEVRGEVLASLVNGRFLVKIAADILDMNLPPGTKPGQSVPLTFMGDQPRLTFSLGHQESGAAPVSLSDAGKWLPLLSRLPLDQELPPGDAARIIQSSVKGGILVEAEQEPGAPPLKLAPGQRVETQILARLPDGRLQVRVADQLLELPMPKGMTTEPEMQLAYISDKPRPTFLLLPPAMHQSTATAAALRWLSFSLATAAATPAPSPEPLMAGDHTSAPPEPSALAGRLREALGQSGVFYESHVARWAEGRMKAADLLREPQGRLSHLNQRVDAAGISTTQAAAAETTEATIALPSPSRAHTSPPPEIADPQTLPIVRQQLALVTGGHFVWQGEAWPGQHLEWKVEEREPGPDDGPERQWQTDLALELPRLGSVKAHLRLHDGNLHISLQARTQDAALLMEQHEQKLRQGLAAGGLRNVYMDITDEER